MNDAEFKELMEHLHRESGMHGDLGHAYWTNVIRQLKDMRAMAEHHETHCLKGKQDGRSHTNAEYDTQDKD